MIEAIVLRFDKICIPRPGRGRQRSAGHRRPAAARARVVGQSCSKRYCRAKEKANVLIWVIHRRIVRMPPPSDVKISIAQWKGPLTSSIKSFLFCVYKTKMLRLRQHKHVLSLQDTKRIKRQKVFAGLSLCTFHALVRPFAQSILGCVCPSRRHTPRSFLFSFIALGCSPV